jgi:hypothetical protein
MEMSYQHHALAPSSLAEQSPFSHWMEGLVALRANLDKLAKGQGLMSTRNSMNETLPIHLMAYHFTACIIHASHS